MQFLLNLDFSEWRFKETVLPGVFGACVYVWDIPIT